MWILAPLNENGGAFTHHHVGWLQSWPILWCGILQSLVCFVPMLESMNALMKFAQLRDGFICDFVAMVKICQNNLHRLYVDHVVPFTNELFSRLPCTNGNKSWLYFFEVNHKPQHKDLEFSNK